MSPPGASHADGGPCLLLPQVLDVLHPGRANVSKVRPDGAQGRAHVGGMAPAASRAGGSGGSKGA